MEDYIKYKRRNRAIYSWPCKLYVPVTLRTKNQFAEMARRERFSQAELGAVIVMHYLAFPTLADHAIDVYRKAVEAKRREEFKRRSQDGTASSSVKDEEV